MSEDGLEPFSPAEIHHLRAAEGWLGLGDWRSARQELEAITPELQGHPWVLHRKWDVACHAQNWPLALEVATEVTRLEPADMRGWLHVSYALHELKRTREARENAVSALPRFPEYAVLRYNLACYECQLGNMEQARKRLVEAFALPGGEELREGAVEDPDLRELWNEIPSL
jgi:Flp pilus assembly protein TadD